MHRLYLPILVVTALSLYGVTLTHGFVWDDHIYIVGNDVYRTFDLQRIFFSLANGVEYSPVTDLSLALDHLVWGNNPAGYHLTNLVLFVATIVLQYLFTQELPFTGENIERRRTMAFLTALLFAVHPLPSEMVNFISCRNGLLSSVAFFGGGLLFARFLGEESFSQRLLAAVAACYLAALLSKASSIVFPLVLLLLAWYIPSKRTVRQKLMILLPFFVMSGLFFLSFREIAARGQIIHELKTLPLSGTIAVALQIPIFYLKKLIVPTGLSAEYANDKFYEQLVSPEVIVSLVVLSALAAIAVVLHRKFPLAGFALLWFVINLLPFLNLFATNPIVADRYAFRLTFAAALLCASLFSVFAKHYQKTALITVVALVSVLSGTTFARNLDWHSDITLWQANIRTEPTNHKGYENLIAEAIVGGDIPTAKQILAERRSKFHSAAYDYLEGIIYLQSHDLTAALNAFEAAVRQDKDHIRSLLNIGHIYRERGNYRLAKEYYHRTLDAQVADGWGCRESAQKGLKLIDGY